MPNSIWIFLDRGRGQYGDWPDGGQIGPGAAACRRGSRGKFAVFAYLLDSLLLVGILLVLSRTHLHRHLDRRVQSTHKGTVVLNSEAKKLSPLGT